MRLMQELHEAASKGLDLSPGDPLCGKALDRIEELNAVIRKHCDEIEARKMLGFEAAEDIFSTPRHDN